VAYRKFVGNVCLYRELAVREPPTFLRRNLDQALDAHGRLLRLESTQRTGSREATMARERTFTGDEYPTKEMLQDLMSGRDPVLRIDALQLRLLESRKAGLWRSAKRRQSEDGIDWLPDPTVEFHIPCLVLVSVLDIRGSRRACHTQTLRATAVGRKDESGELYCDIELTSPCVIHFEEIFVTEESGPESSRRWRRTFTADCVLEVSLQCQDSDDTAALLSQLESRELSRYLGAPANEGVLKAVWQDFPKCPANGALLPLKRPRHHISLGSKYGLDMSIGWSRRLENPLVTLNRLRSRDEGDPNPLTTSSDDQKKTRERPRMHYEFEEGLLTRTHDSDDLCCVFCGNMQEYDSVSRLLLHYQTSHEHFNFNLSKHSEANGQHQSSVSISLAEKPPASQAESYVKGAVQLEWIAPSKAFNLAAHVAGEERWTNDSRPGLISKRGRSAKARDTGRANGIGSPAGPSKPIVPALRARRNYAGVRDLRRPTRKKFVVPNVPGVTMYHTHTMQPIQPGEVIEEDERDRTDLLLAQSQYRNLRAHGFSDVEVEFHQAFNQHLDTERPASKVLIGDGIVRFSRKYRRKLQQEWRMPFAEKLGHLRVHGVIAGDLVAYCLGQAIDEKEHQHTDENGRDVPVKPDSSADGDGADQDTITNVLKHLGKTAASDTHAQNKIKGRCVCGVVTGGWRGCVACDNPHCIRGDFHMACVGLDRRTMDWLCADCSAGTESTRL